MRKVNVFVSSTCYDLSKVRHELHDSIKSLGHTPILSEFSSFPIDPDKKTIENCLKAVKENADVFVLIIGNRLGYQLSNGRSITNSEYLTARELGTPTYIFIDKKTLSFLPSWQRNKEGNYSDIVDDKGIFEFIEELRSEENWTYEFENPREVKQILEIQLSYLFYEALKMRGRFNSEINDLYKQGLSGQALNILFKEDDLYEVDYFIQVLEDEINKMYQLTKDYEYRIFLDSKHKIDDELELVDWFQHKIGSYILIIESLQTLFNDAMSKYIATSDNPFDGKGLYYCAVT